MYDYVLQLGFDKETQKKIENIKKYLKENEIKDTERNWLPHITIDLYNCKQQEEFMDKVDNIIKQNLHTFKIKFKNMNHFNQETLYIEPYNKSKLLEIKNICDIKLDNYRLENRRKRIYIPHVTLCTNENIKSALELAEQKFHEFDAIVKYLWIYSQQMELVKEYDLGKNGE